MFYALNLIFDFDYTVYFFIFDFISFIFVFFTLFLWKPKYKRKIWSDL